MPAPTKPHRREGVGLRALLSGVVLAALAAYAVLWPALAPAGWAGSNYLRARTGPSWPHLMGTDHLGHDVSVRVAEALQVSLAVAVATAVGASLIGLLVGACAAAFGGRVDAALMRLTDAAAAVPHLLATIVVVAMFRGSLTAIIIALTLTHWTTLARIVRAETQTVMASDYIAASRTAGASRSQLVRHHIAPAVAPQAGIAIVMMVPHAIWHESTLSFLGIGLAPEQASLGTLISSASAGLLEGQWWALAAPAAVLVAATAALAMLRPAGTRPSRRRAPRRTPASRRAGEGLQVRDLGVRIDSAAGPVRALDGVGLRVDAAQLVAVIGPSGAGKSTLAHAIGGLLPTGATMTGHLQSGPVGFVPQNPGSAFTPTRHLRSQLAEISAAHHNAATVDQLCHRVGLGPDLVDRFPHQLSGGQLQRAALAAALATGPRVLVADEPTSGLDPELAVDLLHLLRAVADSQHVAVLLITHDVASLTSTGIADRVVELRDGHLTDQTDAREDGQYPHEADLSVLAAVPMPAGVGA
ncbi:ATP-binding cassette domain-containing protein [Dietzia maris]|uniref:ATP-binding cassette domain-containing protein n=1 Tax=Dietzia maris TaxID=37915 RepID=UPI00344C3402